jgi:hypothetical protein
LNYLGLHVQALIVTSRGVKISSKEEIRISIELNKPEGLWTKYFETGSIPSDDFLEIRGQQIQGERESFD